MRVLKFGGSSVGSSTGIKNIISLLKSYHQRGEKMIVVVSAFEKMTDTLIRASNAAAAGDSSYLTYFETIAARHEKAMDELLDDAGRREIGERISTLLVDLKNLLHGIHLVRDISPKTADYIMSFGERASARIIAACLRREIGYGEYVDARSLIRTKDQFGSALVDFAVTNKQITERFSSGVDLAVVTGFIASTAKSETTTLGRGGSDFTASIIGAALKADEIEIWTDVDGVMTADPRKVKQAFSLPSMSYQEALELSHFGAKVIYPPTMQPAMDAGIQIRIKNTFNPAFDGTIIDARKPTHAHPVTGISSTSDVALIRVDGSGMLGTTGILKRIFEALTREEIAVIFLSLASSEHSICLAVVPQKGERAKRALEKEFSVEIAKRQIDKIGLEKENAIIAIVGENMRRVPGISGRMFQALGKNGINIVAIAQGSSELNISAVIPRIDESKALNALHDAFFLSGTKTVNLFIVGTGWVGSTLLQQLARHSPKLRSDSKLDLRIAALSNTRQCLIDPAGIDTASAKEQLEQSKKKLSTAEFIKSMKDLNLPNSILVDCTASDEVAGVYEDVLSSSISVVTPNKRANSGPMNRYHALRDAARRGNVKFFYETNVGAGLPVISTLSDLIASGDEIIRIEAVLSGTLSFIFNTFTEGRTFSDVVRDAKKRGYTEPDPRDDLSGKDVMRKLLILARETGASIEEEEIEVESLVPHSCLSVSTPEEFLDKLADHDSDFEDRRRRAAKDNSVLRYIGRVENGKASVSLQAVDSNHPFFSLSGSDNIISFVTKRYFERPLVVKGPGAGNDVTAAGTFADIIRTASYLG